MFVCLLVFKDCSFESFPLVEIQSGVGLIGTLYCMMNRNFNVFHFSIQFKLKKEGGASTLRVPIHVSIRLSVIDDCASVIAFVGESRFDSILCWYWFLNDQIGQLA